MARSSIKTVPAPDIPRIPGGKKKQAARREAAKAGVEVIEEGDPLYVPQYERNLHQADRDQRHYPDSQYSLEALDAQGDEEITQAEFMRRRRFDRRVWEPIPVAAVIIDFSDVKQPLFPHKKPKTHSMSTAKGAETWQEAMKLARERWPDAEGEHERNLYYWDRMDHGTLPEDFNPYRPSTDCYVAFGERVTLIDDRPVDPLTQELMTRRQVRRRAEKKLQRGMHITDEEIEALYKPLADWDLEELKHGQPRVRPNKFPARPPSALLRAEMKEKIREELERRVRGKLDSLAVDSLDTISDILGNSDTDGRGRPVVPSSVKMRAAEFVVDHMLGKATQRVESDLSAKLMGVLGEVMVAPTVTLTADGVVATGMMAAGQRGQRLGHDDSALEAVYASAMGPQFAIDNVMDAELVGEEGEDDE